MTKKIDPQKLQRVAERLCWVLGQYPGDEQIAGLQSSLAELIRKAVDKEIKYPLDRREVPQTYALKEGFFREYRNPDVEDAYYAFVVELSGGRTKVESDSIAWLRMKITEKKP